MQNQEFRIKDGLIVDGGGADITGSTAVTGDFTIDSAPGRQMVIPMGNDAERPGVGSLPAPMAGTIRYNTTSQVVEIYNGSIWQAASQAGEAVTFSQANEISIINAIIFG